MKKFGSSSRNDSDGSQSGSEWVTIMTKQKKLKRKIRDGQLPGESYTHARLRFLKEKEAKDRLPESKNEIQ